MSPKTDRAPAKPSTNEIPLRELVAESDRLLKVVRRGAPTNGVFDEIEKLVQACIRAGAYTWSLEQRQQLRQLVARWIDVLNAHDSDVVETPDLAPFSGYLPTLRPTTGSEIMGLAAEDQPIVACHVVDADLHTLNSAEDRPLRIMDCAFESCRFPRADLTRARFLHTTFIECDFTGANLTRAVVTSSILGGGLFEKVNAHGSDFGGTRFDSVSMAGADCSWSSFVSAAMSGLRARSANFDGSIFDAAALARDVKFDRASFVGALFIGATVAASFKSADLTRSIFSTTDVLGADFSTAKLSNASFEHARNVQLADFGDDVGGDVKFSDADATAIAPSNPSVPSVRRQSQQ